MRKQKKFKTEKQILDAIDTTLAEAKESLWKAEQLETASQSHFKLSEVLKPPESFAHANQGRVDNEDAVRFRKRATRLLEVRARKLKMALAEFRTAPMPFLADDVGAILPKLSEPTWVVHGK